MHRLDLDYCPGCDLPTFDHEAIVMVHGEFYHRFCYDGSTWVVKQENLLRAPPVTATE